MKNFIWLGAIILIIGALFLFGNNTSSIEPPFEVGVIHPLDYVKGSASSSVILMEYSDFQCPSCRAYYPVVREIMAEFGDRVTLVYRNFPLVSIHANAEFAAMAAEAARKQGKFWEMHDLLFEKQNEWANVADVVPMFQSYADLIGISSDQFKTDFLSKEVKSFVRAQRAHAVKAGLQGTPSFFLNGKQIVNPNSADEFKQIIRNALSSAQ